MAQKVLATFLTRSFRRTKVSIALVEERNLTRLAIVAGSSVFPIPGNQILRAVVLIKMLNEKKESEECTVSFIADLWRKMNRDPLGSDLSPRAVIHLMEALMEHGVIPPVDEVRAYLTEEEVPDQLLTAYLESLLRDGISGKIHTIAEEIRRGKRKKERHLEEFQKFA